MDTRLKHASAHAAMLSVHMLSVHAALLHTSFPGHVMVRSPALEDQMMLLTWQGVAEVGCFIATRQRLLSIAASGTCYTHQHELMLGYYMP
jgi:hypothetical protein